MVRYLPGEIQLTKIIRPAKNLCRCCCGCLCGVSCVTERHPNNSVSSGMLVDYLVELLLRCNRCCCYWIAELLILPIAQRVLRVFCRITGDEEEEEE